MIRTVTGLALLGILSALCIHAAMAQPAEPVKGAPLAPAKPIPVAYWLSECADGPLPGTFVARRWDGRDTSILMQLATGRIMAEATQMGSREKGWMVWSVQGPAELYKHHASDPKMCRVVTTYAQAAASSDALWKDWVTARSTCVGVEKAKPTATAAVPCSDPKTAEIEVQRLAPPVLYGPEDVVAAAKMETEVKPAAIEPKEK